ncbi:MAG: septum formation initiator family protein [Pseudomonadota bacterium]
MSRLSIRSFLLTFFSAAIICYFCYHIISGGRGVLAYFKLNSQISSLYSELEMVRAERLTLEHKTNLLKSDSLDLDLLEEQAKSILGYARPQENLYIDDSVE